MHPIHQAALGSEFPARRKSALLMAGLSLLGALLAPRPARALDPGTTPPPGRVVMTQSSVLETPSPPAVSRSDFKALKQQVEDIRSGLKAQGQAFQDLDAQFKDLSSTLQALKQGQQDARQGQQDLARAQDDASGKLRALSLEVDESKDRMDAKLKQVDALNAQLSDKNAQLSDISDLMTAMKKDQEDNQREIVELKGGLAELKKGLAAPRESGSLLDQVSQWPYLSLTALTAAVVAILVALH